MAEKPKIETVPIHFISPDSQFDFHSTVTGPSNHSGHPPTPITAPWFLQAMMNRLGVSYFKYGSIDENFPENASGIEQVLQRMEKYQADGNIEWLIDMANYCYIEAMRPGHPLAHFRATDSDESPGRVNKDGTVSHGRN